MNLLLKFFEKKHSSVFCILLATTSRVINVPFSSFVSRDKMRLVLQSRNLIEGKGLSVQEYFFNAPNKPFIDFDQLWPPGYPIILAPLLKLFNYDIFWATTTLDLIVAISIIFVIRKLCFQIGLPIAAINLMTLIAGCFEYPAISESQPTDAISLLFFLLGISLSLQIVGSKSFSTRQTIIVGFILFLPSFFRYAYPPMSLAIPILIIIYGLVKKERLLLLKGISLTIVTAIMIGTLFIVLKNITGKAAFIVPTQRGYFPENIIHWYPLVPSAFIDIPFLSSQTIKLTGLKLDSQLYILEIINIAVVLCLISLFAYFFFIKKYFSHLNTFKWLLLWSFVCSLLIFFTLGWLSFTYHIQEGYLGLTKWNYIYEARYYAFATVFIQFLFISWVFMTDRWKKSIWQRIIVFICSLLLFIEISHSIYFNLKVALNFDQYKSNVFRELDYVYFNKWIVSLKKNYPDYEILSAAPGEDSYYAYTTAYYGGKGFYDGNKLKRGLPKVEKRSLLLVMLYDNELPYYASFISNKNVRFVYHAAYSNFYLVELYP